MIGMRDALTLARTKIRSKRIRLLLTTIVSGLVFGVMAGGTILLDGMSSSLTSFARKNLDGRFLVSASPNFNGVSINPNSAELITEVQRYQDAYIAERKAAAQRLGVTYDPASEEPAYTEDPSPQVPPEYRKSVNFASPGWQRYAAKHPSGAAPADLDAFRKLVAPLGATKVYEPKSLSHLQLRLLPGGSEDLTKPATGEPPKELQTAVAQGMMTIVDDELVAPFITEAPGASAKGVPILLSAEDAVTTFGKSLSLPQRPAGGDQVTWFLSLRDKLAGTTFTTCYRNTAEQQRVDEALAQARQRAAAKDPKDYVEPDLQLALPTTPCGQVTIAKDTRSAAAKKQQENELAFAQEFNPTAHPHAELVTFQIVGLIPSPGVSSGLDAILNELVGMNYSFGAIIPKQSLGAAPSAVRHDDLFAIAPPASTDPFSGPGGEATFIASFATVDRARKAVADNSCMMNWTPRCETMPFQLQTFGSNYLAVDDIVRQLRPVLIGLLALAFAIATIIIWAMMGRVMADSRRETAVFRAIGAKRSDIMAVYLTYSVWVALRIAAFAAVLGIAIAGVVHLLYAGRATRAAQLAYGVFTPDPSFSFLGFRSPVLWLILGGILVMSLVAITPPLLRNIRRNPIKDMRDE